MEGQARGALESPGWVRLSWSVHESSSSAHLANSKPLFRWWRLGPTHNPHLGCTQLSGRYPIVGPAHPSCLLCILPPSREDPRPTDDRGLIWLPQKLPLARRQGNWYRGLRVQEMSGRSRHGAGSYSVSPALSRNRLPNYRTVPATPSSCQLLC